MATLDDGAKAEAANNLRSGMEAPDSAKTVDADENEIRKSREKAELGEGKDQDQGNGAESRTNARGDGRVGDEAKRKHLNDETASGSSKKSAEHDDASDDSIRSKKTTETTTRGADDCLTADQLQNLRLKVSGEQTSDEVAEELSTLLGLGQTIRSKNLYIDQAAERLSVGMDWLLMETPKLILARDERARMQLEIYRTYPILGRLASITAGSPTAVVLCGSIFFHATMGGLLMLIGIAAKGILHFRVFEFGLDFIFPNIRSSWTLNHFK